MKKVFIFLSLILFSTSIYAAEVNIESLNTLGMGKADLADVSGVSNPANLGSRVDTDPLLITYFSIMQNLSPDELSTPLGYFQYPYMSMGVIAYGTNLGLTLNIDSYLDHRVYHNDILNYTGYNQFTIQLDWGYRLSNFDFGMRVKGGSAAERRNFELRDNIFFLSDYIVNTFFSEYETVADSEFFNLGFSIRLNILNNFSMAFYSESDVDLSSTSDNNLISYLKASSLGFTYFTNKYSRNNQLNPFVYKFSLDLVELGDVDKRELRLGAEMKLQLGNNNSLALRAGYYEPKATIGDIFMLDLEKRTSTYALVYDSKDFGIAMVLSLPMISFTDINNGLTLGVNSTFKF